jgi:outer membrane protein TolC
MKKLNKFLKIIIIFSLNLEGWKSNQINEGSIPNQEANPFIEVTLKEEEDKNNKRRRKLYLTDLISNIERYSPQLIANFQDYMIAQGELLSSHGVFDPSFRTSATGNTGFYNNQRFDSMIEQATPMNGTSFFAGYRLGRGEFAPYYGERATNKLGEVRAGARIPVYRDRNFDKNRAGIQQAEIGVKLADLSITQQKIEILRTAMIRYWDWVSSIEKYRISENIYKIALERQEQIEKRVKLGELPRMEAIENSRIVLQRKTQMVGMEQFMISASNELSLYLIDEKNTTYIPQMEDLPENPFSQMSDERLNLNEKINKALAQRPELQRLQIQKDQNRIDKELAQNLSKPGVDLIVAASQDFGPGSVTLARPEVEANLVLNIPIQNRTQEGKIAGINAKNAKIDAQEIFLKERIIADIKNISALLDSTKQRVDLSQKEVKLSLELEELERQKFQMGEGTLILVNIRELTTAEAKNREIDSLSDHNKALVNLQAASMEIDNSSQGNDPNPNYLKKD